MLLAVVVFEDFDGPLSTEFISTYKYFCSRARPLVLFGVIGTSFMLAPIVTQEGR